MTNELRYYNRLFKMYRNYSTQKTIATALPFRIWVELHSGCNLKCSFCPNKDMDESQKGPMEWDVFKKVIDESKEFVFDMTLNHRGESLLHPEAVRFLTYAAKHVRFTKLHTNGALLTPEISAGIVDSGLKRLSFSFDGFEKADYEKNRAGSNFEQVVENIKTLLDYRRKKNRKFPVVAIEVIEFSEEQVKNEKKEKFIREFKQLGLDELVIKKPHNWAGYLKTGYKQKKYAPCTFLWSSMLVLWNGDISPCSQDFFGKYIAGNIKEKTLREIWNDGPMQNLRRGLAEGRYREFEACSNCDRLWRDTVMGIPREYLKQLIFHRMP